MLDGLDANGWLLLAQEGGGGAGGLLGMPWFLLLAMILFWLVVFKPQQRERKAHQARLDALKKNDRVLTVGGIYGTVSNLRRDADDVELKTDEPTNSVIHVTFGSISRVIDKEKEKEKE